jgi:hypothetical protein
LRKLVQCGTLSEMQSSCDILLDIFIVDCCLSVIDAASLILLLLVVFITAAVQFSVKNAGL